MPRGRRDLPYSPQDVRRGGVLSSPRGSCRHGWPACPARRARFLRSRLTERKGRGGPRGLRTFHEPAARAKATWCRRAKVLPALKRGSAGRPSERGGPRSRRRARVRGAGAAPTSPSGLASGCGERHSREEILRRETKPADDPLSGRWDDGQSGAAAGHLPPVLRDAGLGRALWAAFAAHCGTLVADRLSLERIDSELGLDARFWGTEWSQKKTRGRGRRRRSPAIGPVAGSWTAVRRGRGGESQDLGAG
jgi:hypothetical protein